MVRTWDTKSSGNPGWKVKGSEDRRQGALAQGLEQRAQGQTTGLRASLPPGCAAVTQPLQSLRLSCLL